MMMDNLQIHQHHHNHHHNPCLDQLEHLLKWFNARSGLPFLCLGEKLPSCDYDLRDFLNPVQAYVNFNESSNLGRFPGLISLKNTKTG
jgi:hypothetical protein